MRDTLTQYGLVVVVILAMIAFLTFAEPVADIVENGIKQPMQTAVEDFAEQRHNGVDFDEGQVITNHIIY